MLFREQGDLPRALTEFRAAVEKGPDRVEMQLALAESLGASGRGREAEAAYEEVLRLDASATLARNNLGLLLAQRGDLRGAVVQWSKVLEQDPERVSTLQNLAFALATAPDPEVRDVQRALELATRAKELSGEADSRLEQLLATIQRALDQAPGAGEGS